MSLRQLETLIAIAETGSFHAAADRMGITQSAVSMQMKALEDDLRAEIFDRTHRPPVLNERGRSLLDRARRILDQYQDFRAAALSDDETVGTLRLGVIPSVTTGFLPDVLATLNRRYPGLQVRIQDGLSTVLVREVLGGQLDAAIITVSDRMDTKLAVRTILEEEMFVVAPEDSGTRDAETLLSERPFIRFNRRAGVGRIIDRALRARGLRVSDTMELDSIEAMLMMVSRGLGVCIAPESMIARDTGSAIRSLPFPGEPLLRRIGLVEPSRESETPLTDALFAALAATIDQSAERTSQSSGKKR